MEDIDQEVEQLKALIQENRKRQEEIVALRDGVRELVRKEETSAL
jgi:hypothetical protein